LFIKEGPDRAGEDVRRPAASFLRDPDPMSLYDGPLIVLTSRLSASASEIVAAGVAGLRSGFDRRGYFHARQGHRAKA